MTEQTGAIQTPATDLKPTRDGWTQWSTRRL
jgi:hypothetical protein